MEAKNLLNGMNVEELEVLKMEQMNNAVLSNGDKESRVNLIDSKIVKKKNADGKLEELINEGWTPLEAQEIIDIETGKIKAEDAELISIGSSDSTDKAVVIDAYMKGDKENMTEKQRKNHNYLYHEAVEELKAKREKLKK